MEKSMSGKEQQESVRRVWTQAGCIIEDEINRLNRENESKTYLLKVKDDLLERARADRDCEHRIRKQAEKRACDTLDMFWAVCAVALIFICYAVWVG